MNANQQSNGRFDGTLYTKNRRDFPLHELKKYAGQWVAFSPDGSRIVDSATDFTGLCAKLDAAGIDSGTVVLSEIHPDEVGLA
jgi:hypothetical protein